MNGKRYTTEDKIRILREADRGEKMRLGYLPRGKYLGGKLPSVEASVWAHGSERGSPVKGTGAGEHRA